MSMIDRTDFAGLVCVVTGAGIAYLLLGMLVLICLEARDRYARAAGRIEGMATLLALILWPFTVLWLHWRTRRGQ